MIKKQDENAYVNCLIAGNKMIHSRLKYLFPGICGGDNASLLKKLINIFLVGTDVFRFPCQIEFLRGMDTVSSVRSLMPLGDRQVIAPVSWLNQICEGQDVLSCACE